MGGKRERPNTRNLNPKGHCSNTTGLNTDEKGNGRQGYFEAKGKTAQKTKGLMQARQQPGLNSPHTESCTTPPSQAM